MSYIVKSFQAGHSLVFQSDCVIIIKKWLMYKWIVDRERIPAGERNYEWALSLPEKAEGFTMRSYPEGQHGLLRCAANRTAQSM